MTRRDHGEGVRVARGALAQQVAQGTGVLAMLTVITALGRSLPLAAFGLYGLLLSVASYALVIQDSIEGSVIRTVGNATDDLGRNQVISTALALYTVAGAAAGFLVIVGGLGIIFFAHIPPTLVGDARSGVLALAAVMALGWPFKVFQDSLRGTQRFFYASVAEVAAHLTFATTLISLTLASAPVWALAGVGASLPLFIGFYSAVAVYVRRIPLHFRREFVEASVARRLIAFSQGLGLIAVTDVIVYALDRVVLAAFRSAATVGLYEAVARPHNLIRQLHGTLVATVVPVASGYLAADDEARMHLLLVRGTRYVLAIVVPVTVVLVVLSAPLLAVWLGPKFLPAAPAMAIFAGYWILAANTGVGSSALVAAGHLRSLTIYAWVGAILNLTLSLVLTPLLGLKGVVIATAAQTVLQFPWFIVLMVRYLPVSVPELARRAWWPAYGTGAVLALGLVAARWRFGLKSLPALLGAAAVTLGLDAMAYWVIWFDDDERLLIRKLLER